MNESKIFEGKNIESATEQACSYFGLNKEELEVEIIDSGSTGIFGLGGRSCIVQAKPKHSYTALEEMVNEVVKNLLGYLVDDPQIKVNSNENRINVFIQDTENSGLIIGKEGQTISALEYLTNRIMAKTWPNKVYVQLDAGGYRQRQDESIRQKALNLAKKVKNSGKMQSTQPMSAYHRRLVHMALQEDSEIQTRSKGEGALKRVLIMARRKRRQKNA